MTPRGEKYPTGVLIAYYLTLAAFFVASFYPQYRVWGINWWAYFPLWVKFGLLATGVVAPFVANRLIDKLLAGRDDITPKTYRWLVGGFAVTMTALFYLLRARTHFLGDGYTLLRLLGSDNPFIKPRNLGGTIFQYWMLRLMGGNTQEQALVAYQIVSIGAGIVFLVVTVWFAAKVSPHRLSRALFVLSCGSCGFVLLFFGYVENYSFFVTTVFAYAVVVHLISVNKISRWWVLLLQLLAAFFHIFGVVLLPATLVTLVFDTRLSRRIAEFTPRVKATGVAFICLVVSIAIWWAYRRSFFFRLSLLPVIENEFTVEGYTMFSIHHLADLANLLFLILPGLLVGILALKVGRIGWSALLVKHLLLVLTVLGCLGAALIFAPGLGMPRDWDLFALAGVPLSVAVSLLVLAEGGAAGFRAIICMITLGFLMLLPRAVVFATPQLAVRHTEAYTKLDVAKSASTRYLLYKHFERDGNGQEASRITSEWILLDPDSYLMNAAVENGTVADSVDLMPILLRCTKRNPLNWTAWGNIGVLALRQKAFDSALYYLQVSDGLNPYNPTTNLNLGYALYNLRDYTKAEGHLKEALYLDSTLLTTPVLMLLADLYRESNQESKYVQTFGQIADRPDAPPKYVLGWIELLLSQGNYVSAAERINRAVGIQIDSAYVRELLRRYPRLQEEPIN